MNVVPYIKAYSHNITVNMCGRKLKLRAIHFLLLQGGINEIGGETEATNQQNRQNAKCGSAAIAGCSNIIFCTVHLSWYAPIALRRCKKTYK
jgi:hypothetical protein